MSILNIYNISYFYSLSILNSYKEKKIKFYKWNKFIKLFVLISKEKFFYIYYKRNKTQCFKEVCYIINKNIYLDKKMKNFIKIIFDDDMFLNIKYIYYYLMEIYKLHKNILYINVITKKNNLNFKNNKKIKRIIKKYFSKKRLFFLFKKDENIIAGFKIYVNNLVFDGSIFNIIKKNNFYINTINLKEWKNVT